MGRILEDLEDGKEYDKNMLCEILRESMKGMWYMVHDLIRKEDRALGILYPSQVPSVVMVKVS